MGKTIAEKIFAAHCHKEVRAGDMVVIDVDKCMGHDANGPLAIEYFYQLKGKRLFSPSDFSLYIDHYVPCPNESVAKIHQFCRDFAKEQQCNFYDAGEGVCHQLMMEQGQGKPGQIVIGTDSHTCTYGALNCFASGVGSTDVAGIMLTGKMWAKVPESMKIVLLGKLPAYVGAKDIILTLARMIKAAGATYQSMEFVGDGAQSLSVEERMTIANMAVELGAKAGLFLFDQKSVDWFNKHEIALDTEPVVPDEDATYSKVITIDLSTVTPQIAMPHTVDNVVDVRALAGMKFEQASLGTCTNGRLSDLALVRDIVVGKKVYPGMRFYVFPASRSIYSEALDAGIIKDLFEAGAIIGTPGCGSCIGACNGIPGNGDKVLSTANRNFRGRMGNPNAEIYLVSPETLACSILTGVVTDPTDWMGGGIRQ